MFVLTDYVSCKTNNTTRIWEFIKCESWQTSWDHAKRKNNWSNRVFSFLQVWVNDQISFLFLDFGFILSWQWRVFSYPSHQVQLLAEPGNFGIDLTFFVCLLFVQTNYSNIFVLFVQTEMKIMQTMVRIHQVLSHSKQLDGCLNWVQQQRKTLTLFTAYFLSGMRYVALCNQQTIFPSPTNCSSKGQAQTHTGEVLIVSEVNVETVTVFNFLTFDRRHILCCQQSFSWCGSCHGELNPDKKQKNRSTNTMNKRVLQKKVSCDSSLLLSARN